jgi:hypothetical protein
MLERLPQTDAGSTQATIVLEAAAPDTFCSIATEHEKTPHKMTPTYQQKQAVLSVAFQGGTFYTMSTRCITQKQEPLRKAPLKIYIYSSRPVQATPAVGQTLQVVPDGSSRLVCKDTADQVVYGAESMPDDLQRQEDQEDKDDQVVDPEVLQKVISELEEQRDTLFDFGQASLQGGVPQVLEELRRKNATLCASEAALKSQLTEAKAVAGAKAAAAPPPARAGTGLGRAPPPPPGKGGGVDKAAHEALKAKAEDLAQRETKMAKELASAQQQLKQKEEDLKLASSGDSAALVQKMERMEMERDLAKAKLEAMEAKSGGGGGGAAANPKSSACVIQ